MADHNLENFERTKELTQERLKERKRLRHSKLLWRVAVASALVLIIVFIATVVLPKQSGQDNGGSQITDKYKVETAPEIDRLFDTANSEEDEVLNAVQALELHDSSDTSISTSKGVKYHFYINENGKIEQAKPLNGDKILIVCDIENAEGKFAEKTYDALVHLVAWLLGQCDLDMDDVVRHYDEAGESCPKYYVENESAWEDFKTDVEKYIENHGTKK